MADRELKIVLRGNSIVVLTPKPVVLVSAKSPEEALQAFIARLS